MTGGKKKKKSWGERQKNIRIREKSPEVGAHTTYGILKFWFVAAQIIPDGHTNSVYYKLYGMERFKSPVWVRGHTLMNTTDPSLHLRRTLQFQQYSSLSQLYKKLLLLSAGLLADIYIHHLPKGVFSSFDLFKLL